MPVYTVGRLHLKALYKISNLKTEKPLKTFKKHFFSLNPMFFPALQLVATVCPSVCPSVSSYNLNFQSQASYDHDPTHKNSSLRVSRFTR